jgi:hypothetical protein
MKKALLTAIAISALSISLMVTACPHPVRADSTDSIYFPDSGVTIFSPVNTTYSTYSYNNLVLSLSLYSAGTMGSLDPQISMTYSIDGIYTGSVPLKSNGELHVVTQALGTVALPELPEGSHCLTLNLYGLNQRTYEPKYLSYTDTVYFSTVGTSPISSPIISPSPTPAPITVSLSESASALNYGNTINFTVSADGGVPPYTYAWYVDGQSSENSSSPYFSTNSMQVGSHHVYVQVSDADNNSATTLTVEFNVLPVSSTSPSLSPIPSPSPPESPSTTITPSPTPPQHSQPLPFLPILIVAFVVAAITLVGLAVYFWKYRRKKTAK